MKKNNKEDGFLGKWLSGNLSDKELTSFEESEDYVAYKDILKGVDRLEKPVFDVEKKLKEQKAYNAIYKESKAPKVIKPITWIYSVAALVLVLIGLKIFFFQKAPTILHATMKGQMNEITLPDNSVVTLNADSSLEYEADSFIEERLLKLNGEAFFDVEKGSSFTVNTINGEIVVLGTEFNVYSRNKILEVRCFEGKVSVKNENTHVILNPGKGAKHNPERALSVFDMSSSKPDWLNGKSSFSEVSLERLIQELERQYDIEIEKENIDVTRVFTGFFIHNNLKIALKTSFEPMSISYTFKGEKTIVLKNK